MFGGALAPVFTFSPKTGEFAEKSAVIGTVIMAAGLIALIIMVLLFPLFLLDKQFPYDTKKNVTES